MRRTIPRRKTMSREADNIKKLIEGKGVQFRDFNITEIQTREAAEGEPEKMIIRGTPAVFEKETRLFEFKDWDGTKHVVFEQVHRDAFDEADMTDVIFNMNHCGRVFARTRNNSLELNVNKEKGLEMGTELWDDDEGHRQLYRDIKRGNIDKMSYAYTPKKMEHREVMDEENDIVEHHFTLLAVERVFDVSAVDIPAYDATEISARRMIEAESGDLKPERLPEVALAESGAGLTAESRAKEERSAAFELEKKILLTKLGGK